ncbi:hypothetical protein CUMW_288260 [Citrus unshiu]|uniref:Uncharacterized protein n=1 Tax=Citrus unshiu TaxID=55188 RepID=A0A2H5N2Y9_CITUN|nr:hypothetical protein CUMW_288260 [Citrus unshiu]
MNALIDTIISIRCYWHKIRNTIKGKVANLCHYNQILPLRSLQHQHLLAYHHFH